MPDELWFHLNRFPIRIPPLEDRREDIVPLARYFLEAEAPSMRLAPAAEISLACQWTGGAGALRAAVRQLARLSTEAGVIPAAAVTRLLADAASAAPTPVPPVHRCDLDAILSATERDYIVRALATSNGVVSQAAALLGLRRSTFIDRMHRHQIRPTRPAQRPHGGRIQIPGPIPSAAG